MGPEDLSYLLSALPKRRRSPKVIVGPENWDDAGVYRIAPDRAIVQTVDFITPVVDDPYEYGRIAAANSLSDVYAMGGRPLTALSIVCFPSPGGDREAMRRILRGGVDALERAGAALLGGHTIRDPEIKFGFAVTGEVHPRRVVTVGGAKPGDLLVLTKPIGTGVLATALKQGTLPAGPLRALTRSMTALNQAASEAMVSCRANAATDITGFGFLGHAWNLAKASGVSLRVWARSVPLLPGARDLAQAGVSSAGLKANANALGRYVAWDDAVPQALRDLLVDPQTSGGLLIAIPASRAGRLEKRLARSGVRAEVVGEVAARGRPRIEVAA